MANETSYSGGENFSLRDILLRGRRLDFAQRTQFFSQWVRKLAENGEALYRREIISAADREVETVDPFTGQMHRMLMFGSNNYLGLTSHPYVRERIKQAVDAYGAGVGGPPLLNGYTRLHKEVEERLSAMKQKEDTVLFQSGYGANVGILTSLTGRHDTVIYDAYSHASFYDGLKMGDAPAVKFAHNDTCELERLLEETLSDKTGDTFVGLEGVYSMDGDLAPLDQIAPLCKQYGATLIIDDAHGTGVVGPNGGGSAEHFGVRDQVDIIMGTFSKAFGVVGGFASTTQAVADYLRFFARSYMFSSSLPPAVLASVLASLDLLEHEPEIHQRLRDNIAYTANGLRQIGFSVDATSGIIPLRVPETMNLRKASHHFHKAGIFINSIEYPAVPVSQQRFRISLMATHTKADIDRLLEVVEEVWAAYAFAESAPLHRTV